MMSGEISSQQTDGYQRGGRVQGLDEKGEGIKKYKLQVTK